MDIAELEGELATRNGFAARVAPPAGLRNVGLFIGVLGIFAAVGALVQGRGGTAALSALSLFLAAGLVVVVLGLMKERWSTRPLHAAYVARGWVSRQVPCGLVQDNSGDSTIVRRDRSLVSDLGDDANPVVLVGGPGQSAESVEAAAAAARDDLVGMSTDQAWELAQRVWGEGLYRDSEAAGFFPVPRGMSITVQTGLSPFILVIPAPRGSRRGRSRYYAIKTPDGPRIASRHSNSSPGRQPRLP